MAVEDTAAGVERGARHARCAYVHEAHAERAIELAAPMLESWLRLPQVCGSGFLHVVVLDPARMDDAWRDADAVEDAVLAERSFGDRARWDADYRAFALAKARLSSRHRMDGSLVHARHPHLVRAGDTLLAGSVWFDGIVVGASGAFPMWDEAAATCIAANLRALAAAAHAEALASGRNVADAPAAASGRDG